MNVAPGVTGPCVAGKNHADKIFFNRDRVTDFELRSFERRVMVRCGASFTYPIVTYQMLPRPRKGWKTVCRKAIDPRACRIRREQLTLPSDG